LIIILLLLLLLLLYYLIIILSLVLNLAVHSVMLYIIEKNKV